MSTVSRTTRKKSWQDQRETANLLLVMADRQARVADTLTKLREDLGLTQEEAAARVDVGLRQWQRWESGESEPYKRNIAKLSDEFDVPVSDFFDERPPDARLSVLERKVDEVLAILREDEPGKAAAG